MTELKPETPKKKAPKRNKYSGILSMGGYKMFQHPDKNSCLGLCCYDEQPCCEHNARFDVQIRTERWYARWGTDPVNWTLPTGPVDFSRQPSKGDENKNDGLSGGWSIGQQIFAQWTDGHWYEATIKKFKTISHKAMIRVVFTDDGIQADIPAGQASIFDPLSDEDESS